MNRDLLRGRYRYLFGGAGSAMGDDSWLLRTTGAGTFDPSCVKTGAIATWIFGDGSSQTANSASHVYAATGNYAVSWDVSSFTQLDVGSDGVLAINTKPWTNLTQLYCGSNSLTSLDTFAAWTNLTYLHCYSNSLPASEIDDILTTLDAAGASNGILNYSSNPGSPDIQRSGAAATSKANLIARGWVITI